MPFKILTTCIFIYWVEVKQDGEEDLLNETSVMMMAMIKGQLFDIYTCSDKWS